MGGATLLEKNSISERLGNFEFPPCIFSALWPDQTACTLLDCYHAVASISK